MELPIDQFLNQPVLPSYNFLLEFFTIYNTPNASITISDSLGNTIGIIDSIAFNNTSGGIPIIPSTGYFHPPIGYILPHGEYAADIYNFSDSTVFFSVADDSIILTYSREDGDPSQIDHIFYDKRLSVASEDNQAKSINLNAFVAQDSSEKYFALESLNLSQFDTISLDVINQDNANLINKGQFKFYNLFIRFAKENTEEIFEHNNIQLTLNTTHQIVPDWNNLGTQPVQILVDSGNTGSFDDTLYVTNQYTGISENSESSALTKNYFLLQNYPNPFNSATAISFGLPMFSHVKIEIFNVRGQKVITLLDSDYPAGQYTVKFNAASLSSGIYFYRIHTGKFIKIKKMILLK